ncbi:hypothetical protein GCM10010982_32480 [Bowmanella pacifica]|uniref:DUF2846 domain-containing protein n=2 Tax=Bowmanella pacifica TaxID=502051 RepID=A0A917Z308_9ALTE|nr:hypothetical protein GCM10010982_32480 [Bowmanella pacifica]
MAFWPFTKVTSSWGKFCHLLEIKGNSNMRMILLLVISALISACAGPIAKGPKFTSHPQLGNQESLFYLYKPNTHDGVTVCLKVFLNDLEKGCLSGQGFIRANLPPGQYKVVLKPDAFITHNLLEFDVTLLAGQASYYAYYTTPGNAPDDAVATRFYSYGVDSGNNVIIKVDEDKALTELAQLNESN